MKRRARDIPASIIILRLIVAEQYGASREQVLVDSGLDSERISSPTNRVTVEEAMLVWKSILRQTQTHEIGLVAGAEIRLHGLGMLGYAMLNSSSMEAAFDKLRQYQRLVMSIGFWNKYQDFGKTRYVLELQEEWQDLFTYTVDFMMSASFKIFNTSTAMNIVPLEVGFHFEAPVHAERYQDFFDSASIKFGADQTYLEFRSTDIKQKMIGSNKDLFEHFENQMIDIMKKHDRLNVNTRKVKSLVVKKLKAEVPKIEEVAREMAKSVRALQLNLKSEGTSFQEILNTVRKEISLSQLKNENSNVTEVAFLTGFSDVSVFSRNFKKWTGLTPTQYKSQ